MKLIVHLNYLKQLTLLILMHPFLPILLTRILPVRPSSLMQQLMDLKYFVVTAELDGQRLDKVLNQPCVDGLVHLHLGLVEAVTGITPRMAEARKMGRLMDLAEWVKRTRRFR